MVKAVKYHYHYYQNNNSNNSSSSSNNNNNGNSSNSNSNSNSNVDEDVNNNNNKLNLLDSLLLGHFELGLHGLLVNSLDALNKGDSASIDVATVKQPLHHAHQRSQTDSSRQEHNGTS